MISGHPCIWLRLKDMRRWSSSYCSVGWTPGCGRWGGTPLEDAINGEHDAGSDTQGPSSRTSAGEHISSNGISDLTVADGNADQVVEFLWAAAEGNIRGLQNVLASGLAVNSADYDGRTALHLGAAEGRQDVVEYLLVHGHPLHVRDRWDATPLDEARRENRTSVVQILEAAASASTVTPASA